MIWNAFTLSDSTSDEGIPFLEQASIINIARSLAAGQSRASLGGKTWGDHTSTARPVFADHPLGQ
jgi:hypothetical protein